MCNVHYSLKVNVNKIIHDMERRLLNYMLCQKCESLTYHVDKIWNVVVTKRQKQTNQQHYICQHFSSIPAIKIQLVLSFHKTLHQQIYLFVCSIIFIIRSQFSKHRNTFFFSKIYFFLLVMNANWIQRRRRKKWTKSIVWHLNSFFFQNEC